MTQETTTSAAGKSIDAGAAFTHLWKAPGGKGAIVIGGLMYMLFFLLFIPMLIATGWTIDYGRAVARGETALPKWRFGQAWTGLRWLVVYLLYFLPIFVILVPLFVPLMLADAAGREPGVASIGLFFVAFAVIIVYQFGFLAILPAVQAIFIAENRIGPCFRPSLVRRAIQPFGWGFLVAPVLAYAAGAAASLGFILCFVGYFFTGFWSQAIAAHLAGQVAQPLVSERATT